jgi:hypothetical protein
MGGTHKTPILVLSVQERSTVVPRDKLVAKDTRCPKHARAYIHVSGSCVCVHVAA